MAFETWHYGTAGHGAATGEPGLSQAWFYLRWFASRRGIGLVAVLLSVVGRLRAGGAARSTGADIPSVSGAVLRSDGRTEGELHAQRAGAAAGPGGARRCCRPNAGRPHASAGVAGRPWRSPWRACSRWPKPSSVGKRHHPTAVRWRRSGSTRRPALGPIPRWPPSWAGHCRVPAAGASPHSTPLSLDPLSLYMDGYDRLIVDGSYVPDPAALEMVRQEHTVAGEKPGARVVISPEVRIFRIDPPRAAAPVAMASDASGRDHAGGALPGRRAGQGSRRRALFDRIAPKAPTVRAPRVGVGCARAPAAWSSTPLGWARCQRPVARSRFRRNCARCGRINAARLTPGRGVLRSCASVNPPADGSRCAPRCRPPRFARPGRSR